MKICVVTPYYRTEAAWLAAAHRSVREQTQAAHHILVCDGSEPVAIPSFAGTHIVLQRNYRDYGNTPRLIGCYQAMQMNADAIAFLDGDNWFYPDHLAGLVAFAQKNQLDACASARMLHRLDGSPLIKCPVVDGRQHIDTSCLLVLKRAFPHMLTWVLLPQDVAAVMDQFVWKHMLDQGARLGFLDRATVAYRTRHAAHYNLAGEAAPPEAIVRSDVHGENYH